jgi:hypothetical protein
MARTFEPKIRTVEAVPMLERGTGGLHRIQRVTVTLDRDSFAVPEIEADVLRRELEFELQERSLLGLKVRVKVNLV